MALALMMLFAFLVWNVIYVGVVFITKNNTPVNTKELQVPSIIQNGQLIINDMQSSPLPNTDTVGVIIITQNQIQISDGLIISAFFIYFIIATNISNYNLFPSQVMLNQSTRQKIYEVIVENEGVHLREICRIMDKKMGVVQYHLYVLENANLINSIKDGRYKRFFVNHKGAPEEQIVMCFLNREKTSKILDLIYQNNGRGITHGNIAKELNSTSQAVSWHIQKLKNAGVILATKQGSSKIYQVTQEFLPILDSFLQKNS